MELIGREEIPEPDTVGDWLRRMEIRRRDNWDWKGWIEFGIR